MKVEIRKENQCFELLVDGEPFTMLCGELHNSSASSIRYMEEMVWPKIRGLHMNSVLLPVCWEQIEQEEGKFDFHVLETIVQQAHRENMKLGILWFGLWKNGISSYIPGWMKQDQSKRFFRAQDRYGKRLDVISPFCEAAVEADARAFQALMEQIEEWNREWKNILLVQVENEMGLLGSDRDYSKQAEQIFQSAVPTSVVKLCRENGKLAKDQEGEAGQTWEQLFGQEAAEVFMEYGYSSAIGTIAAKGRIKCDLPMYVNAWIEKYPWRAGGYPSGGPIARFDFMWRAFVPDIAVLSPDVYTSDFHGICQEYEKENNPLLIPEHRRDLKSLSHVLYAVGGCGAICFSPFGIEDFGMLPEERKGIANPLVMSILNIDVKAWNCEGSAEFLKSAYQLLDGMELVLRKARREGKVQGFLRKDEHEKGTVIEMETCDIRIDFLDKQEGTPKAAGYVLESGENECYIAGVNCRFTLMPKRDERREIGILSYEEGEFIERQFVPGRILNGDERYCMMLFDKPEVQRLCWYFY